MADIHHHPAFEKSIGPLMEKAFLDARSQKKMANFLPGLNAMGSGKLSNLEAASLISFGAYVGALAALEATKADAAEKGGDQ